MAQVIAGYQLSGNFGVTVGGTGTSIKYFPNPPGPSIGVNDSTPSSTSAVGQLAVPGSSRLNGQIFHVQGAGNFEVGPGGTCPGFTVLLQANTGTTSSPTYTTLATSGVITTQANLNAYYPWYFDVTLMGDSGSGIVQGSYTGMVDGTAFSGSTLSNNLSKINFATEPPFGLVLGVQFSVSESGNGATAYQFQIIA